MRGDQDRACGSVCRALDPADAGRVAPWADHEHECGSKEIDGHQCELGADGLRRRPVPRGLGQEDRHTGPAAEGVVADDVGALQRMDGVTKEGDRREHDERHRSVHEHLHVHPPPEAEDADGNDCERSQTGRETAEHGPDQTAAEAQQRLVEECGLEPFAIHGGEADGDEGAGRSDRDGVPHLGPQELHPALVLESGYEPEADIEEHDHGEQRGDPFEHFDPYRQPGEDCPHDDHREGCGHRREGDTGEDRAHVVGRLGRFQVAEQHREQQHYFEAFAEDDDERLAGDQHRRADADIGQRPLRTVDQPAQLDDLGADGFGRVTRADRLADLRELPFRLDRQMIVRDPQRDLDALEVREVSRLRLGEGLRLVT